MSIKSVTPYLNFDGTAAKAIALYEKALGAKTEQVMPFGDGSGTGMTIAPEHRDRVMHARLRIGGGTIMLSDTMPGMPLATETNANVSLDFDDASEMARCFEELAEGGKVTMAIQDTFWGAKFGMLTDAFAIRWMFNCDLPKH